VGNYFTVTATRELRVVEQYLDVPEGTPLTCVVYNDVCPYYVSACEGGSLQKPYATTTSTGTGWQSCTFTSPITLTKGSSYVIAFVWPAGDGSAPYYTPYPCAASQSTTFGTASFGVTATAAVLGTSGTPPLVSPDFEGMNCVTDQRLTTVNP
jgi:hypothetical protein